MSLSIAQIEALAILPKVTGGLSFVFSAATVTYILISPEIRKKFYHRLILGISIVDMCSSSWYAMSTWPVPQDPGALYAAGTLEACRAQGFFIQLGVASPIYNCSIGFFYLFAVKYGWNDSVFQKRILLFHGIPVAFAIGSAIAALQMDLFHNANLWCWIGPNPDGTESDYNFYRMAFFYGPLWVSVFLVTTSLSVVFAYVRDITMKAEAHINDWKKQQRGESKAELENQDFLGFVKAEDDELYRDQGFINEDRDENNRRSSSVVFGSSESVADGSGALAVARERKKNKDILSYTKRRREVAFQCLRFSAAFYITWLPITSLRILQIIEKPVPYPLLLAAAAITPMQGLPNLLAFLFPILRKKLKERKDKKKKKMALESSPFDPETGKIKPSYKQQLKKTQEQISAKEVFSTFSGAGRNSYFHSYNNRDDDDDSCTTSSMASAGHKQKSSEHYTRPEMYMMMASQKRTLTFTNSQDDSLQREIEVNEPPTRHLGMTGLVSD